MYIYESIKRNKGAQKNSDKVCYSVGEYILIIFTHLSIFFFVFFFSPNSDKCSCNFLFPAFFLSLLIRRLLDLFLFSFYDAFYVFFKDNRYFFTHRLFPFLKGIFSKSCHIPLHICKTEWGTVTV